MKITRPMLEELLALTVPGEDEDEPVELTLRHMDNGPEGPGIYAYYSDYPEEGVTLIDGKSDVLRAEGRASVAGVKGAPLVPCPVCGGEAVHAQDLLERTVIQPCDVPPGKWKVDMPDGLYTQMPGDPPGPADLRKIIGGYVYFVTPRSGKLVALNPPRNAGVEGPEHG